MPAAAVLQTAPVQPDLTAVKTRQQAHGRRATTPSSAPRCRSSARTCARRSTCAPAARCSTSRPATATRPWRRRAAGATSPRPTTCGRCSNAGASAPPPRGSSRFPRGGRGESALRRQSFDVVISTFGVMFTADQDKAAAEMLRVAGRGGKIGMANWTPDGFIGQLFKTLGKYVPPPAGVKSPRCGARARGSTRCSARRRRDRRPAAHVRVPLSLARTLARRVQDLLRPDAEGLRGTRCRKQDALRTICSHWSASSTAQRRHDGGAQRISRSRHHQALRDRKSQ